MGGGLSAEGRLWGGGSVVLAHDVPKICLQRFVARKFACNRCGCKEISLQSKISRYKMLATKFSLQGNFLAIGKIDQLLYVQHIAISVRFIGASLIFLNQLLIH